MPSVGMNTASKNMDFLTKHWAPYPRRFPGLFPLVSSDYLPAKTGEVRTQFETCNFSMILSGEGFYEWRGKSFPVKAPCVLTQWPGEAVAYGATGPGWAEWYLVYEGSQFDRFVRRGLIDPDRPLWPIADPALLRLHLAGFSVLARTRDPSRVVDRADRMAERAILDTWLGPGGGPHEDAGIRAAEAALQVNPSAKWDFDELASRHGFSTTTFRRRWAESIGTPPGKYLLQRRIAEACRLLVETSMPIQDVAAASGFDDPFYFSRRFRIEVGHSPGAYRKVFRLQR